MIIVIFALGYFTLKLLDYWAPPQKRLAQIVTCILAIALILIVASGPVRIG